MPRLPRPALAALLVLTGTLGVAATPAPPPSAPSSPAAEGTAPTIPLGSVLRPIFTLAEGKDFEAGTAFAAVFDGQTVVLTAFHLFGPVGGLPAAIPADEMVRAVKKGRFVDAWAKQKIGADTVPLRVPGAHVMGEDAAGDLAVFRVPDTLDRISSGANPPFHGLPLASTDVKIGDRVWLAAPVVGDPAPLHAAKVVEVKPTFLFYEFDQVVDLVATSGGAVVDAKGEVVGIHLGGGLDAGKTIGAAGPVSAIRKNLAATLAR